MQIGAMNHPMQNLLTQIDLFHRHGFTFLDFTLEPTTEPPALDSRTIKQALAAHLMPAVGHTFWALPIAHPVAAVRHAAIETIEGYLDFFTDVGVTLVNVHPDDRVPMAGPDEIVARNVEAFGRLASFAAERGQTVMAENTPGLFSKPDTLARLFAAVPALAFHLDIAHANLRTERNTTPQLLAQFRDRLRHVHMSDNRGGADDLHLPLGAGHVNWKQAVGWLKRAGYDDTITLEVFTPDPDYLWLSQRKLRAWWDDGRSAHDDPDGSSNAEKA